MNILIMLKRPLNVGIPKFEYVLISPDITQKIGNPPEAITLIKNPTNQTLKSLMVKLRKAAISIFSKTTLFCSRLEKSTLQSPYERKKFIIKKIRKNSIVESAEVLNKNKSQLLISIRGAQTMR